MADREIERDEDLADAGAAVDAGARPPARDPPARPPPPGGMASDLVVPPGWTGAAEEVGFVVASMPDVTKGMFASKMNLFYGTSVSTVVAVFLRALFKARVAQAPSQLLIDLVFSTFVSQTISREWATIYNSLGGSSILRTFEISGQRTADGQKSAWVTSCKMNSTAVHALGQCVMESASPTSSLGKKAALDGTVFSPKAGPSEYHKLTNEGAKLITDADRAALAHFKKHGATLVKAVEVIMESGSSAVEEIAAKVALLSVKKF